MRELAEGIVEGDDNPTAARIVAEAFLSHVGSNPHLRELADRHSTPSSTASSVADEINRVWAKICKGHAEPVTDESLLVKRVKWIEAQLDAAETNFRVTNKAYCELDAKLRSMPSATREGALEEAAKVCEALGKRTSDAALIACRMCAEGIRNLAATESRNTQEKP